ncbi:MAG: thioredoxin family protein [Candidatus Acidiferrales bacterium]
MGAMRDLSIKPWFAAKLGVALCLALFASANVRSQDAAANAPLQFGPLEAWKAAVLSGNAATLKALYSVEPPATTKTPKGTSGDPAAEPDFWAGLKPSGLSHLKTRIAHIDSPQTGVQRVFFTLEATMQGPSGATKSFASIAQAWIQEDGKPVIVATQRTNLSRLPQPIDAKPDLYPDASEAHTDIGLALSVAAREHRRVLLDFGGNWCYDCHVLDETFHYPEVARILDPNYVVVHINIGQYDANLDLAQKYQIPLKKGVPSLAVLDSKGNLLVSQKNGDFENTTRIGLKDVEQFLETWKP